jgi:hypothetical protein
MASVGAAGLGLGPVRDPALDRAQSSMHAPSEAMGLERARGPPPHIYGIWIAIRRHFEESATNLIKILPRMLFSQLQLRVYIFGAGSKRKCPVKFQHSAMSTLTVWARAETATTSQSRRGPPAPLCGGLGLGRAVGDIQEQAFSA